VRVSVLLSILVLGACTGASTTPSTHSGDPAAPTTEEVEALIASANYCDDATDCVDIGATCPFGCWILVNAAEADEVEAAIGAWAAAGTSSCTFSCANRGEISCSASGVCEAASTSTN
jgi:hypothetical protein